MLNGEMQQPRKGADVKDVGDHPPITPTSYADEGTLDGDSWRLYDFVTRTFIASISPDCKYDELTVTFMLQNEEFTSNGKSIVDLGWTSLMPWKQISEGNEIPPLKEGDILQIGSVGSAFFIYIIIDRH